MSMVLFYERINWEDFPSVNTAINAIRLNKMDYAVKTMDERTVALDTAKAEKSVVLNTIKDWSLDEKTGIITITKVNGDVLNFDLNIEKIPVKFELSEDGILTMTTDDGSKFTADIGSMIPVIEFRGSDTITVAKYINNGIDKTYSFTVKDGSITEKKLQPNYLADIKVQAESAELSATASAESAKEAKSYAIGGTNTREGEDTDNAKYYAELAKENIEPVMNAVSDISLNRQTLGYVKKNLCNYEDFTIEAGTNNYAFKNLPINWGIEPNKTYTVSFYTDFTNWFTIGLTSANTSFFGKAWNVKAVDGKACATFTTPDDLTKYQRLLIYAGGQGETAGNTLSAWDIQIEVGSTATDYEPYVDDVDTRLKALTPVNNLLATVPGRPLDATMGKALKDEIDEVNSTLTDVGTILSDTTATSVTISGWTWTELSPSITLPPGTYVITACARVKEATGTFSIRLKHETNVRASVSTANIDLTVDAVFTHIEKFTTETTVSIEIYGDATEFVSPFSRIRAVRIK